MFFEDEEEYIQNLHNKSILSASFWKSLIGTQLCHFKYGQGIIYEVEKRKDAEPVIKIKFGNNPKLCKEFLFSSFVEGKFTFSKELKPKIKRYTEAKIAVMGGMV